MFFNKYIDQGNFPFVLKERKIKKDYKGSKGNYHRVCILPIISKIYEKIL